jgi:hypothetical protein
MPAVKASGADHPAAADGCTHGLVVSGLVLVDGFSSA